MDPNANVTEQWEIAKTGDVTLADRLTELRSTYAEWRSHGGYKADINPPTSAELLAMGFKLGK